MSVDIYKYAAQNRLRFPSSRGSLTVEQLFDLPLRSTDGLDLDNIARRVNSDLKSVSEDSFVDDSPSSPLKDKLTISLDIVKDVIRTKLDENKAMREKQQRAVERKKLLDAIGAKKDAALTAASLDELEKKLAELDG